MSGLVNTYTDSVVIEDGVFCLFFLQRYIYNILYFLSLINQTVFGLGL